jgi:hypothetical protein
MCSLCTYALLYIKYAFDALLELGEVQTPTFVLVQLAVGCEREERESEREREEGGDTYIHIYVCMYIYTYSYSIYL